MAKHLGLLKVTGSGTLKRLAKRRVTDSVTRILTGSDFRLPKGLQKVRPKATDSGLAKETPRAIRKKTGRVTGLPIRRRLQALSRLPTLLFRYS